MWTMGHNDGGELNLTDSFNGRKLRPLIPRSATSISPNNTATTDAPCLSRVHGTDLLALNHHLVAEQTKREFNTQQQVVVSSRWNPTPEQLETLEELYRRGTRTPSADQIQHITAQLRRYGKIEGKNVFYWFQNHKARERQKRRRQLESVSDDQQYLDVQTTERKESVANRTGFEVEQTKSWALPTNCSTLAERTVSVQRAAVPECRPDGWVQFDEEELQQRKSLVERNATWQMMQLSCSPPTHLINTTTTTTATVTRTTITATTTSETVRTMDPKFIKRTQDQNIFIAPYREDLNSVGNYHAGEASCGASQTLQLFPLQSGDRHKNVSEEETQKSFSSLNSSFTTPYQFFEFLPLKN